MASPATPAPVSFPLCRYGIEFELESALTLPDYAGSLFRGSFGQALRHSCPTWREGQCHCDGLARCAYSMIFSAGRADHSIQQFSQAPNPFVLIPPAGRQTFQAGEMLRLEMVLIGEALPFIGAMILAWRKAGEAGFGKSHVRARLTRVLALAEDKLIYQPGMSGIAPHPTVLQCAGESTRSQSVTLEFFSPLRLMQRGNLVTPETLTPRLLLTALLKRIRLLADLHTNHPLSLDVTGLLAEADELTLSQQLQWFDWKRYSTRQQKGMVLGGMLGSVTLSGELAPFIPWLVLGQWLHIGKNCTFGLGGYRLLAQGEDA
ncbi:hypothetical protein WH50_13385 [Pokkaliibacter plantistimulans]|uniref:CRISPR-associated protein Cas6 C-terminal domain-containing protein n=2 Tax=Pokkaliibacter plantistimulans TaxID=1635171 RepID=A0ABX5M1U4_9GAMM|nr:hypothetical protein WH50_13385 [Pokkaliibacter plantistimulans]